MIAVDFVEILLDSGDNVSPNYCISRRSCIIIGLRANKGNAIVKFEKSKYNSNIITLRDYSSQLIGKILRKQNRK